ncbi:hypothetical protein FKM82_014752 [Ascaphus truei]
MDPAAPATRMTSSFTINISTPSFYNPPKKFAPVVPPKPKLNPFKESEGPGPQDPPADFQEQASGPGIHRAFVGKVGEIPSIAPSGGEQEDFVLPPPPPAEDSLTSPTASFPPPPLSFRDEGLSSPTGSFPPPPPPDFSELFPLPGEESFPSPPPLEETTGETIGESCSQVNLIQNTISVVPPPPPPPPIFSPKPAAPSIIAPKPTAPKPAAPHTFSPKPALPHTFSPKPALPITSTSTPVAPTSSAPAPPSTQTFSPKPIIPPIFSPKPITPPTFAPKLATPPSFTPKSSAPHTFSPKPVDPPIEVPQPPQKFPSPQPAPKLTPKCTAEAPAPPVLSGTQSPGFTFVQQREKPRVLEKPKVEMEGSQSENVRSLRSQAENVRSLGSQPESVRILGTHSNGTQGLKSQPEVLQNKKPQSDGVQKKGPQPDVMPRPPETDQAGGPQGLNMKEVEELEMLTQQLMREMDNQPTPETHSMGQCGICGRGLSRTETVVRAGEHLYHVACFTCTKCDQQLQGQQYYESAGRPLCEECYQDTLECCAVCEMKITERLLRAMGKAYHPSCFTCAVCKRSLQGEPFIVDQNNQPHCVADYHRRYAPRCSVCGEPIAPEPGRDETVRVVALEKNFHMMCYKCEDCACPLSIDADDSGCFPLDGHVLCKKCHTMRARAAL